MLMSALPTSASAPWRLNMIPAIPHMAVSPPTERLLQTAFTTRDTKEHEGKPAILRVLRATFVSFVLSAFDHLSMNHRHQCPTDAAPFSPVSS
jgi:hypothetical protein